MRATNLAYTFFRVTGLTNEGEPVGAQGVPLTPGRSIAVDHVHEYGTPFFIEANLPIESVKPASPFRRLMIAQDTGSAIVGPARADLYFGAGDDAGRIAGSIRHRGRFVMLLPRELDMVAAGSKMPLPVPKPKIVEVAKQDGKRKAEPAGARPATDGRSMPLPAPKPKLAALEAKTKIAALEAKKQGGKGGAEPANSGAGAAGRQVALPAPKSKTTGIEVKTHVGKGKAESASVGKIAAGGKQEPPLAPKSKTPRIEVKKQNGKGKLEAAKAGDVRSR